MAKFNRNSYHLLFIFILIGSLLVSPVQTASVMGAEAGGVQSVIVQAASVDFAAARVTALGGEITSRLQIINGVGANLPSSAIAALENTPGITRVTGNASTHLTATRYDQDGDSSPSTDYADLVGADLVWQQNVTGSGITVAVIDTGVAHHPSLYTDKDGNRRDPFVAWVDFVEGKKHPVDPNGHGTHIAGIIMNASRGEDGEMNGVAPEVHIAAVRVLDETGTGDYEKVIEGIQWVVEHKDTYNIRVLNLSLYSLVQSPYWADPLNQAVMRAWAEGITVIVAAGNSGPTPMTISVPGNVPYVITVGAFSDNYTPDDWNDDVLASFSSAGPTLDAFTKPDLLAPGAHVVSTMMPGSYLSKNHEANRVNSHYFSMAGTSQAAAVVSGVAALVYANNPDLTPDQIKYRLMVTSLPWITSDYTDMLYSVWQQGAGRVNAYDATFATGIDGVANLGMDIVADIAGEQHYEGYSYFDEVTNTFRLHGFETLTNGYGSWAGGYGSWAGGYGSWAGGYGSWAGGYGSWAGGYGSWAGGYGSWAGGYGSWAGGYGSWAGGYGSWAGGYGSWAGQVHGVTSDNEGYGDWTAPYYDPVFFTNFSNGTAPETNTVTGPLIWIEETR